MLLGLVYATRARSRCWAGRCRRHVARVLPEVGALVEGPGAYGHLSGRDQPARCFDAAGPGGARRTRRARVGEALERVGLGGIDRRPVKAYSLGMRQRLGLAAALLRTPAAAHPGRADQRARPAGHPRDPRAADRAQRGRHHRVPVQPPTVRSGATLHPGRRLDRGRLVLQDELATLRAPTGRVVVATPDTDQAVALLDGRVEARGRHRLLVRHDDPAALNANWSGRGIRVAEMGPQRRGTGGDRARGDGRRLRPGRSGR